MKIRNMPVIIECINGCGIIIWNFLTYKHFNCHSSASKSILNYEQFRSLP